MTEIEKLNMIAEWQEQHKQLIENLDNSKKCITDLEEKISVLLSCKNCPENKGGYICEKEYENKCLAQKMQYIKELQKENTELNKKLSDAETDYDKMFWQKNEIISNAKEIIKKMLYEYQRLCLVKKETIVEAEQFLSEVEK